MTKKRFFPASIVDEAAYYLEVAAKTPIIHGWTLTLEGEVSSRAVQEALDACLNYYPKFKCILIKNYSSIKRLFRYCWEYQDIKGEDILQEIENPETDCNGQETISHYMQNHSSLSIDVTCHVAIKVDFYFSPCRCRWDRIHFVYPEVYSVL